MAGRRRQSSAGTRDTTAIVLSRFNKTRRIVHGKGRLIIGAIAIAIILLEIFFSFCWYKKYFPLASGNDIYVINLNRGYLPFGIVLSLLGSFLSVISIIYIADIFLFWFFYLLDCLLIYATIAALLEKCVIKTDSLTLYTLPMPPKVIKFSEITSVKLMSDHMPYGLDKKGLAGYRNKKKLFFISEREKGYDFLLSLFLQADKVENSYRNGALVSQKTLR